MKLHSSRRRRKEFEEIEYKPKSVKETLVEMKDISELIVDLAYAAIIFDSRDLAEEVNELELTMDKHLYQIRMGTMLSARTVEDAEQLAGILQVAAAAEAISNAAGDIVELLDTSIEKRPFIPFYLSGADEKIRLVHITPRSNIVGRSVGRLGVETETGMKIIAIRREGGWVYGIEPDIVLRAGDMLVVRGVEEGYRALTRYADGSKRWPHEDETGEGGAR